MDHMDVIRQLALSTEQVVVSNLRVKLIGEPSVIRPAEATERRSFFLSNIDQVLLFTVETVHFFAHNPRFLFEDVVELLRSALSRLLVQHYEFLAGRLRLNPEKGRFEIDCNAGGALFAVANSEVAIEDLNDITYPNPAFKQLLLPHQGAQAIEDLPLCLLQVTKFRCGGFTIGVGTNHSALDGLSASHFLRNVAALAAGLQLLAIVPCNDRSLLKARCPLRIEYDHPELVKLDVTDAAAGSLLRPPSRDYVLKLFKLSGETVQRIKSKALRGGKLERCSGFEAVTAHLWKARTLALGMEAEETSWVLFAVDMRPRMDPPLPREYAGNAVFPAYASASAGELEAAAMWWCVAKVQEGVGRITDAYLRSCIDWGELHRGIPRRDDGEGKGRSIFVSSWWRLGLEEVEYPWGKPLYSGPVIDGRLDIVLFLANKEDKNGVNVFLALDSHSMSKFCNLFLNTE
eukprot:PITA_02016